VIDFDCVVDLGQSRREKVGQKMGFGGKGKGILMGQREIER